ncbi:MAG: zf-TFIIB domain-containing protein, partial [Candidatus Omnitrophica bacterium]|nr:zf-TFIIB domain-containing protein [Candidatus Omnitrophota bacterium]
MFQRPDCLIELRRAKSALGNAWGCPQCRGRVLGMAFLRRTLDKTAVNTLWQAAREADATQGKACPGCGRPMREVTITAAETPLQLDVCCSCQFVWFDNLEFEQIPAAPEEAPPPEREILPPRAREALAMMQVQSIQEKLHREDVEPNSDWWTWPALFGLPVEMDGAALRHLPWV